MYNMSLVEERYETLTSLFEKYQRNLAGVSAEDREGKYKNAFTKLRQEILYAVADYAFAYTCCVYIPEGSTLTASAVSLVKKFLPSIMNVLWVDGLEKAEEEVEVLRNEFLTNYYFPAMRQAVA